MKIKHFECRLYTPASVVVCLCMGMGVFLFTTERLAAADGAQASGPAKTTVAGLQVRGYGYEYDNPEDGRTTCTVQAQQFYQGVQGALLPYMASAYDSAGSWCECRGGTEQVLLYSGSSMRSYMCVQNPVEPGPWPVPYGEHSGSSAG